MRRDPLVRSVRKLRLAPGDVLVIETPYQISMDEIDYLKSKVQAIIPGNEVMVVAGAHLGVLSVVGDADA